MLSSIIQVRTIAILSFLILAGVQYFLIYNTYELKNDQFFISEKNIIKKKYEHAIRNDKIFPGGQSIIDTFLYRHIYTLEKLYKKDKKEFTKFSEILCDSIFTTLIKKNNVDSLIQNIIKKNDLDLDLLWASKLEHLGVTFNGRDYITLYDKSEIHPQIPASHQNKGIVISGLLNNTNASNQTSAITISAPTDYSSVIGFSLHIDTPSRTKTILLKMMPTLLLALFSIISLAFIFYLTFSNWIKQKKLADMKSDFVNSITHEFHTPLATIIIANKNLQNEKILDKKENIKPLTDVIHRQATRLKYLFAQVLDIATMDKTTIQKTEYSLPELLDEIIYDYRLKLTENNVNIIYDVNPNTNATAILDRFWFTTMLLNLFENGIKYNENDLKILTVKLTVANKIAEISVSDNGVGMSEKTIKHIYDKFYRSTDKKEDVSGLGLGLFYTKQCVEAHEWKIKLDSEEKKGSTFTIIINLV